ncbi:hypothetical protein Taro_007782 [Colocasia esculenta]|uniref:Uncharacterized protein n=1 Tax=Colocasia esculenta TaxID=4460 RepID=A0A843TZ45_COLES|nr:hypothetical protein [Colocasia esculenta]
MRNALSKVLLDVPRRASSPLRSLSCSYSAFQDAGTILIRGQINTELRSWKRTNWLSQDLLLQRLFSTGFTSVHGERPSAEYAKLRKESLESEFGTILGAYSSKTLFAYYRFGPFLALYRAATIFFQVAKLTIWHFFLQDIHGRAIKFRETLIRLGPFYIKRKQDDK